MSWAPKRRVAATVEPRHRAAIVRLVRESSVAGAARTLGMPRLMVEQIAGDGRVMAATAARVRAKVEALIAAGLL